MIASDAATRASQDRAEIYLTLQRYFNGVDADDAERVASCFTPDAHMSYSLDLEGKSRIEGTYADWEARRRGGTRFAATNHAMTSCHVDVEGDEARSDTFALIHLVSAPVTDGKVVIRGLRYRDTLRRTEAGWRIVDRVHQAMFQYEAHTVAPAVPGR